MPLMLPRVSCAPAAAGSNSVRRKSHEICRIRSSPHPNDLNPAANEHSEWATRTERAADAASERACRGVRGAKPLGSDDRSEGHGVAKGVHLGDAVLPLA